MGQEKIENKINELLERIVLTRKQKGWTHENMAQELGISAASYHKIENQVTKLSLVRFLQICETLDLKMEELFGLSGTIYNQEFRDYSANKLIQNIYHDNKELTERYINRLEEEIKTLKNK